MDKEEFEKYLESDISPTVAMNILINACATALKSGVFGENSADELLIKKALVTFKEKIDENKNFMIKVK